MPNADKTWNSTQIVQNGLVLPVCQGISFTHLAVMGRISQKQGVAKTGVGHVSRPEHGVSPNIVTGQKTTFKKGGTYAQLSRREAQFHYPATKRGKKITLIICKKKNSYSRLRGALRKTRPNSPPIPPIAAPQIAGRPEPPESPELSTPASNKPRISPDYESSHAILTTRTLRSGHWQLPWELSRAKTGRFQPLASPNPPETTLDRKHSVRKKVWAIPFPRRER